MMKKSKELREIIKKEIKPLYRHLYLKRAKCTVFFFLNKEASWLLNTSWMNEGHTNIFTLFDS